MTHPIIAQARANYEHARATLPPPEVGPIWQTNLDELIRPTIRDCHTPEETIFWATQYAFYDFTCKAPLLEPGVLWYLDHLKRNGLELSDEPGRLGESSLIPDERCLTVRSRRLSTDYLYRVAQMARLRSGGFLDTATRFIELGGGYGSLARVLLLALPVDRYVLVDLPETLFFAEVFLTHAFPDRVIEYARDDVTDYSYADILFIPVGLESTLKGSRFDLAINTNSLGEMPGHVAKRWIDWLKDLRPQRFWSLNRFLNHIPEAMAKDRLSACGNAFLFGPEWNAIDWEVNPSFERCPYYMSTVTRNLHTMLTMGEVVGFQLHNGLALQDWATGLHWNNFSLQHGTKRQMQAKIWPDLTPDLTMSGPLYALWNAHRCGEGDDALLRNYLSLLSAGGGEFEEAMYLQSIRQEQAA